MGDKELALRPSCKECGESFELRTRPTPEQEWQGVWYDHPVGDHKSSSSVLIPSPQLRVLLAEQEEARRG